MDSEKIYPCSFVDPNFPQFETISEKKARCRRMITKCKKLLDYIDTCVIQMNYPFHVVVLDILARFLVKVNYLAEKFLATFCKKLAY